MVGVVDVGLGNIKSITNWLDRCIVPWKLIKDSGDTNYFDLIVLPGVGSVLEFMTKLTELKFTEYLQTKVSTHQRILGICLGAQVLFDYSEEDGGVDCLGLIKGKINHIPLKSSNTGWMPLDFNNRALSEKWKNQKQNISRKQLISGRVFFNHNYGIKLEEKTEIDLKIPLNKLSEFSALVHKENIIACQFHPEKSQKMGELFLKMVL
jgi:glutamine amidotransferase